MRCGHDPLSLQALIDGELDAVHAAEVEQRLNQCPDCATEHARLEALDRALRAALAPEPAPDRLKLRLAESLAAARAAATLPSAPVIPLRRPRPWAWMGGGAGAAIAACVSLFVVANQASQAQALTRELVADHVRSLQADHLTDVATSNQHVVKPWFDGRLDFAPPVVDLVDQGFPLVGGRLDYLSGRPVAAIVYHRGRHTLNLFVWPDGAGPDPGEARTADGYGVRCWRASGMRLCAVSDVNAADLAQFETLLKARGGG